MANHLCSSVSYSAAIYQLWLNGTFYPQNHDQKAKEGSPCPQSNCVINHQLQATVFLVQPLQGSQVCLQVKGTNDLHLASTQGHSQGCQKPQDKDPPWASPHTTETQSNHGMTTNLITCPCPHGDQDFQNFIPLLGILGFMSVDHG